MFFLCQMSRVFANGREDWGSIPCRVIPKTQKLVLDAALFNTQHYKVRIKGKVEQSRQWSSILPLRLGVVSYWKVLPLRASLDLGEMAIEGYATFPESPSITGTSPSDCLVLYPGRLFGDLTLYCPNRLGNWKREREREWERVFRS